MGGSFLFFGVLALSACNGDDFNIGDPPLEDGADVEGGSLGGAGGAGSESCVGCAGSASDGGGGSDSESDSESNTDDETSDTSDEALLPDGDFENGAGDWRFSGGAPYEDPTIVNGQVCASFDADYTFGWPAEGTGLDLQAGDYVLSFDLAVEDTEADGNIQAKVAFSEPDYTPVYLERDLEAFVGNDNNYSVPFSVEEDATGVGIAFNVSGLGGVEICFDNIALQPAQ